MTNTPIQATISLRGVVFDSDDTVLIVQRASDDGWELPGGRLDSREDVLAGLRRELAEETALQPSVICPVHTVSWRNNYNDGRFAVYYLCHYGGQTVTLSNEHTAYRWIDSNSVRSWLSETQSTAVERAASQKDSLTGLEDATGCAD